MLRFMGSESDTTERQAQHSGRHITERISNGQYIYKKCSTQHQRNETTMKFCLKKPPNAGKNEEKLEFSYIASGRVN